MQTRKLELFTTIHTEGAILPVDILQRILDDDSTIEGTSPESYHLGSGEKINEAVNRSWNRLQGLWLSYQNAREKLLESDAGTSLTRDKWLLQLFQELGYGRLQTGKAIEHDTKLYAISHQWKHTPIHLVSFKLELDKRQKGATGASKSSPHSLMQELLNASDDHLWGFVSNGLRLRILRDSKSLTRQSYVEFDVEGMMNGEVYSDFVLLWMLCHQSRVEADKPEECWLEKWSQTAQEQGTRALDQLRNGVEQAIKELGQGFLSHAGNAVLRDKLKSGALPTQEYYRQLFRLVYRLLFLFVAEDRDLLLHPKAEPESRERYNKHYSLTRLRRMASKLRGSKHSDAWEQVRLIMDILSGDTGYDALGLPALGGYLFSDDAIPDLHDCDITNHDFLSAVRALAFIVDKGTLRPVDYKNLRSEEFGSVYESLLELHPVINADAGTFELKTAGGNERKTTASYYTHDSLVQCLLDSALDPVVDEACKKPDPEKAILALKVCDFASGSGHFLTAAAHRMAKRLAGIRTEEQEPAPESIRTALRDVIGHCIYGVDINPMAVELCKVALWMEALEGGKPLSFLDHHIQCGNSLIGATPALLKKGIPDEAFTAIEGDDKAVCKEYKKRNKQEREKLQTTLFDMESKPWMHLGTLTTAIMEIDSISDATVDGVKKKQKQYEEFVRSTSSQYGKFLADTWCAAFVWKKTKEFPYPISEEVFRNIEKNPFSAPIWLKEEVERLAKEYQFFHWQLAFPDVFFVGGDAQNEQTGWSGGFDVLLGNPPWEQIKIQEREWFETRNKDIASATRKYDRKLLIDEARNNNRQLHEEYLGAVRNAKAISLFLRNSGLLQLCIRGDVNTYSAFAEIALWLVCEMGMSGIVLPTGIATDEPTKDYFSYIIKSKRLSKLYGFENENNLFVGLMHNFKYCLMTVGGNGSGFPSVDMAFSLWSVSELGNKERHISMTEEDIRMMNPNTLTCPMFRNYREAEVTRHIYRRVPVLENEQNNLKTWDYEFRRTLQMANDSYMFRTQDELSSLNAERGVNSYTVAEKKYYPLYEAKMTYFYEYRYANAVPSKTGGMRGSSEYTSQDQLEDPYHYTAPRYWVAQEGVDDEWGNGSWGLAIRRITGAVVNQRTTIAAIIPKCAISDSLHVLELHRYSGREAVCLLANINSIVFDFIVRQKIGGNNLNKFIIKQLPALPVACYYDETNIVANWAVWLYQRVIELVYTSYEMKKVAEELGYLGSPFKWNAERRFYMMREIDAAYAHLYALSRDQLEVVLEHFASLNKLEIAEYGEYRTKRVILEMYDEMKVAIESGNAYQTRLDPPPADERVAHGYGRS